MNEGSPKQSVIGEGAFLRLVQRGKWEFVERVNATGVVGIVAVNDEGSIILVEQHRPAVEANVIEIPAGLVGDEDARVEDMADAARRELLEETGYIARRMLQLTQGPPSAGLSSEIVTFFLASGLKKRSDGGGTGSEQILVHEVPLAEIETWLAQREGEGLLIDPKVYLALYFVKRDGGFTPPAGKATEASSSATSAASTTSADGGGAAASASADDRAIASRAAVGELQASVDTVRVGAGQTVVAAAHDAQTLQPGRGTSERGDPAEGSGGEVNMNAANTLAFVDESPSTLVERAEPDPPPPDLDDGEVEEDDDALAFTDDEPAAGPTTAPADEDEDGDDGVAFSDDSPASGPAKPTAAMDEDDDDAMAFTDDEPAAGPTTAPDDDDAEDGVAFSDDESPAGPTTAADVDDEDGVAFSDDSPASGPAQPTTAGDVASRGGGRGAAVAIAPVADVVAKKADLPKPAAAAAASTAKAPVRGAEDSDDVIDMADAGAATGLGDMTWMRPDAEDEESILVPYSTSTEDTADRSADSLGIPEASTDYMPIDADVSIPVASTSMPAQVKKPGVAGVTAPGKPADAAEAEKRAKRPARLGRFAGLLLGTAVGDAIGLPYEGMSARRIMAIYGRPPLKHRLLFGQGLVSDDTEHACMTAQAWLASNGDPVRFESALAWRLRWWIASLPAGTGLATAKACLKLWAFVPPKRSGVKSAGNGPCMRAPVLALLARDDYDLERLVMLSTRMTHTDSKAFEAAFAVAQVARYIAGRSAARIDPLLALDGVRRWARDTELERNLQAALLHIKRGSTPQAFCRSLGMDGGVSGYVCHTVPVALYVWARHHLNYRKAVEEVVMLGGDTDSTAAIVGALVGTAVGDEAIPEEWIDGMADYPRTVEWIRSLAYRLAQATAVPDRMPGQFPPVSLSAWPVIPARNLAFASIALTHGMRRLLPPYAD